MRAPEFGGEFEIVSETAASALASGLDQTVNVGDKVRLFRPGTNDAFLLLGDDDHNQISADNAMLAALGDLLPLVFRLDTSIALPDSVPIGFLAGRPASPLQYRDARSNLLELLFSRPWSTAEEVKAHAPEIYSVVSGAADGPGTVAAKQRDLGRKLLIDVCGIDPKAFDDLAIAMKAGREGQVNGLIQNVNNEIARKLNFPRWWAQDREFRLLLSPREHELCFTIHDRTGTDYSFGERSRGLQYFLSYYIQLRAHQRPAGRNEILLMDEPDAYLSSLGQQDLLRVLEALRPAR